MKLFRIFNKINQINIIEVAIKPLLAKGSIIYTN
jgi:hypothetical protein